MALYDRDGPHAAAYEHRAAAQQRRITAMFDAEDKARDPLAFYWRRGVRSLRDRFTLPYNFAVPAPDA